MILLVCIFEHVQWDGYLMTDSPSATLTMLRGPTAVDGGGGGGGASSVLAAAVSGVHCCAAQGQNRPWVASVAAQLRS